jgi:hypothetical protein
MSEFKTLNQLIEYMNDHLGIFGWKSRCEALTEFAEALENELSACKTDRIATSQKLSDALDALFTSTKLLNEARAEIEGAIKLCGEYAVNAKEGLFASMALSVGRLKHQIECELEHKKKLSNCANAGMVANEKLFNQLAEARAEIERLSLSVGELNGSFNARPKCEKCKTKDKLIEQMREALVAAKNDGKMQSAITYQLIRTAISAAERINE